MKLNQAQISRTLSQFGAQVLAEDHPAVAQFCELFGHHTSFSTPGDSTCWSCSRFLEWKLRTER